ncbi:MAG: type II toxin-antitoxin system VapC family toxin [Armatimonadota bacterium]
MLLDTCFLIDLAKGDSGALKFIFRAGERKLHVCPIVIGEFLVPFAPNPQPGLTFLQSFEVLPTDELVAAKYAQLINRLGRQKTVGGTNDIWIAATAVVNNVSLITRNTSDFSKIPELQLLSY